MLIRWIGTEVRVFAYFQNLALIACFLGFGLGCYWSQRRKSLLFSLGALAVLVLLVEAPNNTWHKFLIVLSEILSFSPDAAMWGFLQFAGISRWSFYLLFGTSLITVAIFLLLLVAVMIPMGQWVGYYLDQTSNPVRAYSVNLLGSLAGIWIFAGIAFLSLPPEIWFCLAFSLLIFMPPISRRVSVAGLVLLVASLFALSAAQNPEVRTFWSPYQKLELRSLGDQEYLVQVNNTGYMNIANATPEFLGRHPEIAINYREFSSYDAPYRFAGSRDRVLIVGAGAGNDAAGALRNGAQQVDAVEIDPVIYALGKRNHPEHPYDSPKVHLVLNDARAFLRQAQGKYDVIMFGLLDSHTQFSDFSNMRIDNYVYTEESFRDARRLLKPGGILVLKFEVRPPWTWLGQRFYAMLNGMFDRAPIVFHAASLGNMAAASVFIESNDPRLWERAKQPDLALLVAKNPPPFPLTLAGAPPPATDDWPYVYHVSHSIPRTYLTISLVLLVISVLTIGGAIERRRTSTWHFFFLGAGFLLLETQMISRLALYFGTTWLVNCVALSAILLVLVAANFVVARRKSGSPGVFYVLLVGSLLANYAFPWGRLPYEAHVIGALLSVAYSVPVFCAGIIFAESFRQCSGKSSAFGANIVGAVLGGLAQNLSFVFGMKALLLVAAVCYVTAGLCSLADLGLLLQSKLPQQVRVTAAR
jgi:spermidine synthase